MPSAAKSHDVVRHRLQDRWCSRSRCRAGCTGSSCRRSRPTSRRNSPPCCRASRGCGLMSMADVESSSVTTGGTVSRASVGAGASVATGAGSVVGAAVAAGAAVPAAAVVAGASVAAGSVVAVVDAHGSAAAGALPAAAPLSGGVVALATPNVPTTMAAVAASATPVALLLRIMHVLPVRVSVPKNRGLVGAFQYPRPVEHAAVTAGHPRGGPHGRQTTVRRPARRRRSGTPPRGRRSPSRCPAAPGPRRCSAGGRCRRAR